MTNQILRYKVLTPKGWLDSDEILEGMEVYSVDTNLKASIVKVSDIMECPSVVKYTTESSAFEAWTATDMSILYLQDYGVANGKNQHTDVSVGEIAVDFLFRNLNNFRIVVPTSVECVDSPILSDTRHAKYFDNLVKSKNIGLKVQKFSKSDAINFVAAWHNYYHDIIVDDDQMAMDMQHVFIRAGLLSYASKTPLGRLRVNPYVGNEKITFMKSGQFGSSVLKYTNEEGRQIHTICRSPSQCVYIM